MNVINKMIERYEMLIKKGKYWAKPTEVKEQDFFERNGT